MHDTPSAAPRSLPEKAVAAAVLALVAGPIGTAVFVLGFVQGDSPCILCWAQRTAMVLIAVTGLFIMRFGARPRYIGLAVLIAAWGVYMGMRHSALHMARDIGQGFSLEILGAHTYTWSFFIFWMTLVLVGALVMGLPDGAPRRVLRVLGPVERLTGWLLVVVVAANAVQAFASTGPPPYVGQSDPVRFSWNPAHWVWSTDEWSPAPIGWRGRFSIPRPDTAGVNTDPAAGPLAGIRAVTMRPGPPLSMSGSGPLTDLAYDAATDRFVVTAGESVTVMTGTLDRVLKRVTIDPGYSVDVSHFAGTAFLDSHTVIALAENKSYVVVREKDGVDQHATFRFFLDNSGGFEEVARGRFATVRARMNYVLSLAWDEGPAVSLHARAAQPAQPARRDFAIRPRGHDALRGVPSDRRPVLRAHRPEGPRARRVHGDGRHAVRPTAVRAQRHLPHPAGDRSRLARDSRGVWVGQRRAAGRHRIQGPGASRARRGRANVDGRDPVKAVQQPDSSAPRGRAGSS